MRAYIRTVESASPFDCKAKPCNVSTDDNVALHGRPQFTGELLYIGVAGRREFPGKPSEPLSVAC